MITGLKDDGLILVEPQGSEADNGNLQGVREGIRYRDSQVRFPEAA